MKTDIAPLRAKGKSKPPSSAALGEAAGARAWAEHGEAILIDAEKFRNSLGSLHKAAADRAAAEAAFCRTVFALWRAAPRRLSLEQLADRHRRTRR